MKKLLSMLLVLLLVSGCAMLPDASSSRPSASSQPSHTTGTHTTIGRPTEIPTVPTVPSSLVVTEPPTVPTVPTVPATEPTEPTTVPTAPPTEPPPPPTTLPPREGQIRLYTCDVSRQDAYIQMAIEFYLSTGVAVVIMMPREGETCEHALTRYMLSNMPPTVFCVHDEATLQRYAQELYDLSGTAVAGQLYSGDFGVYSGEKLVALPMAVEWFGYIYNKELLGRASYAREDFFREGMTSYDSMAYIRKYITSQKNTLGAYPFGKPDLLNAADDGLAAMLSRVFAEPQQLRSFLDLYVSNSRSTTDALASFKKGEIVFYAGTTACFDEVLTMGIGKLELLPGFAQGSSAMQYTCDHFWAVTDAEYAPDTEATLKFLKWMVTARENGAAPIDDLGMLSPYKDAAVAENALVKLLRQYMAEEPAQLLWHSSSVEEEDLDAFRAALNAYYLKPNDTNWAAVEALIKKKNT